MLDIMVSKNAKKTFIFNILGVKDKAKLYACNASSNHN